MNGFWPEPPTRVARDSDLPPRPAGTRIKVLHVITKFQAGAGGNTYLSATGMDPRRYEMWVASCPGGEFWERAERAGVQAVRLPRFREYLSPFNDLIVLFQLVKLIRRERFAIVHTHSSKGGILGRLAAWVCRTPVVVHTFHGFSFHAYMSSLRRRVYLFIERLVRPMGHAFLAVAPEVAREAVEMRVARPGSITVIPSAVEVEDIPARPDPRLRQSLGIPPSIPIVGTVGRLTFQKAPLDFVRMAGIVKEARPDTRFVMVGDGPLEEDAAREAHRLGVDILFTGFRPDAPQVAALFDVFVISSLYEGLGRALTEALASGRPVVATAVNGVPNLVEHGSTGLLASPVSPESLATCVTWLLEHPESARQMGQAGRQRVLSLFHPQHMCALLEETYARLLGLPPSEFTALRTGRDEEPATIDLTMALRPAARLVEAP